MTQAAVSYQIKLLEERLGRRCSCGAAPGRAHRAPGGDCRRLSSEAFDTLRAAFASRARRHPGVLTISAAHAFAANWLAPRIGAFQLAPPDTRACGCPPPTSSSTSRARRSMPPSAWHGPWPGLAAHRLFPVRFTPLCSPELLRRAGPLREAGGPAAPAAADARPTPGGGNGSSWPAWPPTTSRRAPGSTSTRSRSKGVRRWRAKAWPCSPRRCGPRSLRSGRLVQPFDLVGGRRQELLAGLSRGAPQRREDPRLARLAARRGPALRVGALAVRVVAPALGERPAACRSTTSR